MTKVNSENMKELYNTLWNIFLTKNHDYGNSFELSLDRYGLVASIVRMEDKMNRLSTLTQGDKDAQIASESLVDTLMDLSNYAAMSACWLMHKYDDSMYSSDKIFSISTEVDPKDFKKLSAIIHGSLEEKENPNKLSSFEGHQEKINERAYYNKDDISDEEIIKNWGIVGDTMDNIQTIRSRTTGQYFTEDDNPELFRKICEVLQAHYGYASFKKMKDQLTGTDEEFEGKFNDIKEAVISDINRYREGQTGLDNQPLLTDPKGLENGYFIRQHTNHEDSSRYTLAFNPEGTVKTHIGDELPYVIECFGNDYDDMTSWTIHVFETREDMVAALNYDLKVRDCYKSKNFGDSIKGLRMNIHVYDTSDSTPVTAAWMDTFGEAFIKNMTSRNIFNDGYFGVNHGVKTFGVVFISEKTGALVVKGLIRERYSNRNHHFVWFSDTKEVLLEVNNIIPKFNKYGIIYGIDSRNVKNGDNIEFNPLYQTMEDNILSKFHSWDGSELKNLVFFNEDEVVSSEFTEKRMQIPGGFSV